MYIKIALVLLAMVGVAQGVTMEWDAPAVGTPVGYSVYRQQVVGAACGTAIIPNFTLLASTLVGVREYTDSATVIGANYYNVTAYNAGGESLPSNQICFQGVQKTSAPQNLRFR